MSAVRPRATARFIVAALLLLAAPVAAAALRHNRLIKAEPAVDGVVTASPALIRLWFKEPAEVSASSIKLSDSAGSARRLGPVTATDEAGSIVSTVPDTLAAGRYTVAWKTASKDGHVIRGSYTFTVKP